MFIQIITPEEIIFEGDAKSVSVPGFNGSFQILKDHMAIVSTLKAGVIKIETKDNLDDFDMNGGLNSKLKLITEGKVKMIQYEVIGGTVEVKHNKLIVLSE